MSYPVVPYVSDIFQCKFLLCWLALSTWCTLVLSGKRKAQLCICLYLIGLWAQFWGIFLIIGWSMMAMTLWVMLLQGRWSYLSKKVGCTSHREQVAKQHVSIIYVVVFLPSFSAVMDYNWNMQVKCTLSFSGYIWSCCNHSSKK